MENKIYELVLEYDKSVDYEGTETRRVSLGLVEEDNMLHCFKLAVKKVQDKLGREFEEINLDRMKAYLKRSHIGTTLEIYLHYEEKIIGLNWKDNANQLVSKIKKDINYLY